MKRFLKWLKSGRLRETKLETFTWVLLLFSLAADGLNMFKRRECFLIWFVTSLCWGVVDYKKKIYAQAVLCVICATTSVIGWFLWGAE